MSTYTLQRLMQSTEEWIVVVRDAIIITEKRVQNLLLRSEFLRAVLLNMQFFWDVTHVDFLTLNIKAYDTSKRRLPKQYYICWNIHMLRPFMLLKVVLKTIVMELWWMIMARENRRARRETCVSAILSTTNPTCTVLVSDLSQRFERRKTNRLSHGNAF